MDGSETSTRQRRSARGIGGSLGNAGVVGTTTVGNTAGTTNSVGTTNFYFLGLLRRFGRTSFYFSFGINYRVGSSSTGMFGVGSRTCVGSSFWEQLDRWECCNMVLGILTPSRSLINWATHGL